MADVKILTESRVLLVEQSMLRGGSPRVFVDVCVDCGSIVFDVVRHAKWHDHIPASDGSGS